MYLLCSRIFKNIIVFLMEDEAESIHVHQKKLHWAMKMRLARNLMLTFYKELNVL